MYVKAINGVVEAFPYGAFELMRDNPNTSFPEQMSDEVLARFNIYPVAIQDIPKPFDPITQNAIMLNPAFVDESWVQTWSIANATDTEVEQRLISLSNDIRETRNMLLSKTDWTALTDNTMTPEMAFYRQALRDITKQSGFPTSILWPEVPA